MFLYRKPISQIVWAQMMARATSSLGQSDHGPCCFLPHARIQEFSSGGGGGPGQSDKKALTLFFLLVLSIFYRSHMAYFKESYHLSRFQRGSNFFQWGGGGGSNCLFPIETHITCDFPGGSGPPVPPLGPHLFHERIGLNALGYNANITRRKHFQFKK